MGLYLENGYADQKAIIEGAPVFCFEIGGRGTGKTYGTLEYVIDRKDAGKFLYLRRTQTEIDTILNEISNPFKAVMRDREGMEIRAEKRGKQLGAFMADDVMIGYCAALSTFANIRGVDFSDVDLIVYDEFIPEKRARPIRDEYEALLNLYETINRNRELNGVKPVRLIALANSNDIANPIFMGLQIVNKIGQMMERRIQRWKAPDRELEVIMLHDSPISEKKRKTALYSLTGSSEFTAMALENIFKLDTSNISSRKISEYRPVVRIGELTVYKHKSRPEWYLNSTPSGTPRGEVYTTSDTDRERFRGKYAYLYIRYMQDNLIFEDATSMILFERLFK